MGLAGPTLFSQILAAASAEASAADAACAAGSQKYVVLLIITDGAVNDMDNTISAIVAASRLPLSVLIVGVGQADFGSMERLDGDKQRLSAGGVVATRDIVQFVPIAKYMTDPAGSAALARELLAEIPAQLLSYMASKGQQPRKPMPAGAAVPLAQPTVVPVAQLGAAPTRI